MDRTHLLDKLWECQRTFGYIPDKSIADLAKQCNVATVEIESLVSFYHFFHRSPTGRHIIYLNKSIVSEIKGYDAVKTAFEKETNCQFNETGSAQFSLFETSCIGMSDQEPAALIDFQPLTDLTPKKVKRIINRLKDGVAAKEFASKTKSKIHYPSNEHQAIIFRSYKMGKSIEEGLKLKPETIIDKISNAKLLGLGGAFFPVGYKWRSCYNNKSAEKYIICNADEGEPGTFKDRALLQHLPGLVIEGMILAAYAVGAKQGIIYLRAEYQFILEDLQAVLQEFREANLLGNSILGKEGFDFDIRIQLGAGSYVCGAASALIESLEGRRGEPPVRKWSATKHGFRKQPTVVNNVETLAYASRIIELGESHFLSFGTEGSPGTKLISISGDVAKPGIYEIEHGLPIIDLLSIGMSQATSPYYIQVGGPSGECINHLEFNRRLCKEDIMCGGSFMVFNRTRDILNILRNFMEFFKEESCGICTPCRAGNFILTEKVKKLQRGLASIEDIEEIKQWGKIIKLSSRCGLGKSSSNNLLFAVEKFKDYIDLRLVPANESKNVEFDMEDAVEEYDSFIKDTQT